MKLFQLSATGNSFIKFQKSLEILKIIINLTNFLINK